MHNMAFVHINVHLPVLDHFIRLSSPSWNVFWSSSFSTTLPHLVSSANFDMIELMTSTAPSMSLMNMTKRAGPRQEPWTTPEQISPQEEVSPFSTTRCFLPTSQFSIHLRRVPWIPSPEHLVSSRWIGTLSKAFEKSKYTTSSEFPSSMIFVRSSKYESRLVSVLLLLMNPCWLLLMRSYSFKCSIIASQIIFSMTLQSTHVRLTGR